MTAARTHRITRILIALAARPMRVCQDDGRFAVRSPNAQSRGCRKLQERYGAAAREGNVGSPSNPFASGDAFAGPAAGGTPRVGDSSFGVGGELDIARPPVALLAVAAVLATIGIALALLGWASWLAIIGWAFAGPISIGVLALFVARDTSRRALPTYLRPDGIGLLYAGVATLVVAGIAVSAFGFALWVGHR